MKPDYKKILLIGFGFLATSIAWSVYNAYVPLLLQKFLQSTWIIGAIMTIDNVFGAVFQPVFGNLSDKTRTRFGRRMPYIMIGVPVCAAAFFFVPFTTVFWALMAVLILFNFVMSVWRAPVIALMPDLTPSAFRSQANGIINFMGGIGSLIAFLAGGILFNFGGMPYPFIAASIAMFAALIVLRVNIREPMHPIELPQDAQNEEAPHLSEKEKKQKRRSLLSVLLAILFWFMGFNAVETFFSLYVTNTLKNASGEAMTGGDASIMLSLLSLAFLVFAIPAGFIGGRVGRKKTIITGLAGITALFSFMYFVSNVYVLYAMLIFGGIFWACVNVNSLPIVVDMAGYSSLGKYTGYYYLFSFSASITSPVLFGAIRDALQNYHVLFIYSAFAFAAALICMLGVSRDHAEAPQKVL